MSAYSHTTQGSASLDPSVGNMSAYSHTTQGSASPDLLWVTCQPTVTLRRAVQVLCLWDVQALILVMGQRESQLCLGGADDDLTRAGQVLTLLGAVQSSTFWEQYKS